MSLIEVYIAVMVLGVVTHKYKHLRHCSILQYILIVRHFVVGLDLGAMKCMAYQATQMYQVYT